MLSIFLLMKLRKLEVCLKRLQKNKLTVMGAPMSIYYDDEFNEDNNDTEVAVPVKENSKDTRVLKGRLCAVL